VNPDMDSTAFSFLRHFINLWTFQRIYALLLPVMDFSGALYAFPLSYAHYNGFMRFSMRS